MTGITAIADNSWIGVVGVGRRKTVRGMTGTTFSIGNYMAFILALGHRVVVATRAFPDNIRMIIAAIWSQFQKMAGIVAVIAFGVRRRMKFRFTDGHVTIVTFTAISKNFLVINRGDNVKTQSGMTAMAIITGSGVTW